MLEENIDIQLFLDLSNGVPIIDVRSPAEFEKAHIPGAFNVSLFSNEERAIVGTIYKKQNKEKAILTALDIIGPKLRNLVEDASKIAKNGSLLVHCWRGGMRSNSMAWLFKTAGIECKVLNGGYKTYRQFIKNEFSRKANIIILSGSTGSGKTDILHQLKNLGEQIIDLEGIANHKGSAFGGIGQKAQTQTEQFENNLYEKWKVLDRQKTIWIEDESKSIGRVFIPDELFIQMRNAPVVKINLSKNNRVKRLVREYTHTDKDLLIYHLNRIKKRLGPNETKLVIKAVEHNNMEEAVRLCLCFYDKAYDHGLLKRNINSIQVIDFQEDNPLKNAEELIRIIKKEYIKVS